MGLYRRTDSRFWWMSYTWKCEQYFESTKCRSKALANKILGKREGEIAMQMFKVGQQGERMSFTGLCKEFESAHVPTLAASTQINVRDFLENMRKFFGDRSLADIDAKSGSIMLVVCFHASANAKELVNWQAKIDWRQGIDVPGRVLQFTEPMITGSAWHGCQVR